MNWKEREKLENAEKKNDAYKDSEGVWRWKSSNNVPFDDMLECWNLSEEEMKKCAEARDADNSAFLKDYRERMKNHVPSDEEMFEMKAAFGEGETVVNVLTGKTYKL